MARMLLLLLLAGCSLQAQDHHYWTHQFGTRSGLRGGAVVGGVDDTSAVYYNPGRTGFVKNDSLKVSATAYQLSILTMKDGAGKGIDLNSIRGDIIPLAASGVFLFDGAPGHAIGFQILARQFSDFRISARREALINVIDDARSAGPEDYIGSLDFRVSTEEYWAGLNYSWAMTDWLAIGMSNFGCLRFDDLDLRATSRAVNATPAFFGADNLFNSALWNLRIVSKLGIALDFGNLKFGVTVTSPGIHVAGGATVSRELSVFNLDSNGDGTGESFEASARREGLSTRFNTPWSFASGMDWIIDSTTLSFTWEWFLPVGKYAAVRPNDNASFIRGGISGGPSAKEFLTIHDGRRGAFNLALAVENRWDEDWAGMWSFRSDYAADYLHNDDETFLGVSSWNLFHFATGIAYTTRQDDGLPKHELMLGLQFTLGAGKGKQPISFDNPQETGLLFGTPVDKTISYFAISLIVGYTYYF
ncbi:MAG: hypothetical protein IPP14_06225 [Planctomycetes bacterium]|nr:hypothetical protein [Planctomycetota bacterium]